MFRSLNPYQIPLFPDLFTEIEVPSIATLPEFDYALKNFIKLSDFGAFIELNISGIDKSYSLNLNELQIPRRYLVSRNDTSSPVFHLFPLAVRKHLNRLKYEVRSFFTKANSLKTSFGYFLYRPYFHLWDFHKRQFLTDVSDYLRQEIGEQTYQKYFMHAYALGLDWLKNHLKKKFYHLLPVDSLKVIGTKRRRLRKANVTLSQIDHEDSDYLLNGFLLKTMHLPIALEDYIQGIAVLSHFKTIPLEHLRNVEIDTIEDIAALINNFPPR
jgi:hypothetical protein